VVIWLHRFPQGMDASSESRSPRGHGGRGRPRTPAQRRLATSGDGAWL